MKIVIVGAGVAGLATGWRLVQAGADVTVLERAQPGQGATWAAAGMIAPSGEKVEGAEAALGRRAAEMWPSFAAEIEAQSGRGIGYRRDGALLLALTPEDEVALATRAEGEPDLQMLTGPQALERVPALSPLIAGAVWAPGEARVDNRALGLALADAFVRTGGNLQRTEAAVRIEHDGQRIVAVRTPFNVYHADAILMAAGAWSSEIGGLPPHALPSIKPIKGEMIAWRLPPDRMPPHVLWGNAVYLVPRRDWLLAGATVADAGFDTALTDEATDWLSGRAASVLPSLKDLEIADHWAGLRPLSADGLPVLGPAKLDGLFVASGQYRNGILFAPAVAEALCRTILDGALREEFAAFDPRRFA